jgi:hypothetical protein
MVSMNGHFAMIQTFAWGNMLWTYSNESSLSEAIEKTFDGEHPCHLCKLVKKSKNEDNQKPLLKSEIKMEIALPKPVKVPLPVSTELAFLVTEYSARDCQVCLAPPFQPPRVA